MSESLSLTDNRNGKQYEMPIMDGAIAARALQKVRTSHDDAGLVSYDPGYLNTATAMSRITLIKGLDGTLTYRGYPIEELVHHSNYLEVAYLLIFGELPDADQDADWRAHVLSIWTWMPPCGT